MKILILFLFLSQASLAISTTSMSETFIKYLKGYSSANKKPFESVRDVKSSNISFGIKNAGELVTGQAPYIEGTSRHVEAGEVHVIGGSQVALDVEYRGLPKNKSNISEIKDNYRERTITVDGEELKILAKERSKFLSLDNRQLEVIAGDDRRSLRTFVNTGKGERRVNFPLVKEQKGTIVNFEISGEKGNDLTISVLDSNGDRVFYGFDAADGSYYFRDPDHPGMTEVKKLAFSRASIHYEKGSSPVTYRSDGSASFDIQGRH